MRMVRWGRSRLVQAAVVLGAVAMLAGTGGANPLIAQAAGARPSAVKAVATTGVQPNKLGELDCNGYSRIQQSIKRTLPCTDLFNNAGYDTNGRFYDNGHYIGHDEPDLTYHSAVAGSGGNVTWTETLGKDPSAKPTVKSPGHDVTHNFELSAAPWFSMAICDGNSYPQLPCTPNSDANAPAEYATGAGAYPGAGSAFEELQFYPPGFAPFADAVSCDNTHWCAALNIDSLECTFNFVNCNPNCQEPVNFAFIQTNGVPAGPPSPQLTDLATFTPNSSTLLMNQGDRIRTHLFDAPVKGGGKALEAVIDDLTTGQRGYMQASAANGFMNTSLVNCTGTPFNFEPEYSTASPNNFIPWAALRTNISTEFEIGHFEACNSLSHPARLVEFTKTDKQYLTCHGVYESTAPGGDGAKSLEVNSSPCYYRGDSHPGLGGSPPDQVTGCLAFTAGGDLDFDGSPYWADWPTSTSSTGPFPSSFVQLQPTTVGGAKYGQFQFQTDVALSETATCTPATPSGCTAIPSNAPGQFYPYWTLQKDCSWNFGNVSTGNTFGQANQYGKQQLATLGYAEIISQEYANRCA